VETSVPSQLDLVISVVLAMAKAARTNANLSVVQYRIIDVILLLLANILSSFFFWLPKAMQGRSWMLI